MSENYEIPYVDDHCLDKGYTTQVSKEEYIAFWQRQGVPSWKSLARHERQQKRLLITINTPHPAHNN